MSTWTPQQLRAIETSSDVFLAPLREDGTTYRAFTQTWGLVVDGEFYVRAANGPDSKWYQAAISQRAGRVRVGDQVWNVTFTPAAGEHQDDIDAAYHAKYAGSSAVSLMTGPGPKQAVVRIDAA